MDNGTNTSWSKPRYRFQPLPYALIALNVCRMYLHAVTILDISTADGLFITNPAWSGMRNTTQHSKYQWPRTHIPGNSTWQLWQEALEKAVVVPQATDLRIHFAIGHWIMDTSDWQWFTDDINSEHS
jgi:hypothetical protein